MEHVNGYVSDEPLQERDSLPDHLRARAWAQNEDDPWNQLILSLDGGGIRGYSSLLILQKLMEEISIREMAMKEESENDEDFAPGKLLPCHYFDYMYGTSTGGLIATMLGRLRMSVPECLRLYRVLGQKLFGHRRPLGYLPGATKYRSNPLKKSVVDVVQKFCKEHRRNVRRSSTPGCDGEDPFWWTRHGDPRIDQLIDVDWHICQAICVTIRETPGVGGHMNAQPCLLRTYLHEYQDCLPPNITRYEFDVSTKDIKIWQVARATSAAPTFFKLLKVKEGGKISRYKDGGMGISNPSKVAYSEFRSRHGPQKTPALLLSLGTGLPAPGTMSTGFGRRYENPVWNAMLSGFSELKAVLGHMVQSYTACEGVHQDMLMFDTEDGWYKRLNIPLKFGKIAMDEWKRGDVTEYETGRQIRRAKGGKTLQKMTDCANAYFEPSEDNFKSPLTKIKDCAEKLVRLRRARVRDVNNKRDTQDGPQLEKRWDTYCGRYLAGRVQRGNLQKEDIDRPLTFSDQSRVPGAVPPGGASSSDTSDARSQSTTYSDTPVLPANGNL